MKTIVIISTFLCICIHVSGQKIEAVSSTPGENVVDVENTATTGAGFGIRSEINSTQGRGVYGFHNSTSSDTDVGFGVYGLTKAKEGRGVVGYHNSTTGTGYGVYGLTDSESENAVAIRGEITSSNPGIGSVGIYGINKGLGTFGQGILGNHFGGGNGVRGISSTGIGVYGWHASSTGTLPGVYGVSWSTEAGATGIKGEIAFNSEGSAAVVGINKGSSSSSSGVFGKHDGDGIGVYGQAIGTAGIGVVGLSDSWDFWAASTGVGAKHYGMASSRRWKTNIRNIENPLEKIAQLRGVYFNWKEDQGGGHDMGFIAEEVGKILPEIVSYEKNGIDASGMDYSKTTPLIVEAVNAMRAEYISLIEKLKNEMERLKNMEKRLRTHESGITK